MNNIYNVIASGSTGNAVLYHNSILVDVGVPFSLIKPYMYDIQIVLLTHEHLSDHLNITTLEKLQFERPTLRIMLGKWMLKFVKHLNNLDIVEVGELYDYGSFKISPIKLFHDVKNVGYRIFKDDYKIIHCTDTKHLDGITAKNYSLYALEHNYNNDTIHERIAYKEANGIFCHEKGSIETHLSEQQARAFIFENKGESYEVIRLHESKS